MLPYVLLSSSLVTYCQEGFAEDCHQVEEIENYVTLDVAPKGSLCRRYASLQSYVGVSCFWVHPFRSTDADQFFERIWAQVTNCRQGELFWEQKNVNHPDSYHQRKLVTENGTYRVSKKDKGLEKRTLIFLSFGQSGS
ncbi:hypothetical protein [Tropicibacter sp. Alg240-R139]|uniref:hypothetical protein n=1 Tax=Tropicibacter sp. Alg240-R139 TaxID=2305991 RepID=UPI0013DF02B3|nr:hypothetical protein [Tropicibacter sp. Alg240-R139]